MPIGRLIDQLKLSPLVWGLCYGVVAEDLEYASDALEELSPDDDASALREIERLFSNRAREREALLSGNPRNRPVGPFSSVVLEALSIRRQRDCLDEEIMGGWLCHARMEDAIFAAQERFTSFCATSEASFLSSRFQVYSARMAGRFAKSHDVARLLAGSRSANDPQTLSDMMTALRGAGIDGVVVERAQSPMAALVVRGCALSQLRQVRRIEVVWDGDQATVNDRCVVDQDSETRAFPTDPGLLG